MSHANVSTLYQFHSLAEQCWGSSPWTSHGGSTKNASHDQFCPTIAPMAQPIHDAGLQWRTEHSVFWGLSRLKSACMASEILYAGVVYLRLTNYNGNGHISLVLKWLLAKLIDHVKDGLHIPHNAIFTWTDNMIWLVGNSWRFKAYVRNSILHHRTFCPQLVKPCVRPEDSFHESSWNMNSSPSTCWMTQASFAKVRWGKKMCSLTLLFQEIACLPLTSTKAQTSDCLVATLCEQLPCAKGNATY